MTMSGQRVKRTEAMVLQLDNTRLRGWLKQAPIIQLWRQRAFSEVGEWYVQSISNSKLEVAHNNRFKGIARALTLTTAL